MAGSINFATGVVVVDEDDDHPPRETTLKDVFYENYISRKPEGVSDEDWKAEARAYVDGLFVTNGKNGFVFRDYTSHTMRIFYNHIKYSSYSFNHSILHC